MTDSIAYTINEAVNGAMGGPVGLEQADFSGNNKKLLLGKETAPAVPCPPAANAKNDLQRMMCSQAKLASSFPALLIDSVLAGNQLLALRGKPTPSAGDIYLASHYALELTLLTPATDEVTLVPNAAMNKLWDVSMQATSDTTLRIFIAYWRSFSLESKDWMPDPAPQNKNRHSIYSPDGQFYLAMEPPKDEPSHFVLYRTRDGQKLFTSPTAQIVLSMAWSRDSTRFATVAVPYGTSQREYREVLSVYSVR